MFDKVIRKAELLREFLKDNPKATYFEIEKETGIKRQTACRILKQIDFKKHDNRFKSVSRETMEIGDKRND